MTKLEQCKQKAHTKFTEAEEEVSARKKNRRPLHDHLFDSGHDGTLFCFRKRCKKSDGIRAAKRRKQMTKDATDSIAKAKETIEVPSCGRQLSTRFFEIRPSLLRIFLPIAIQLYEV